MATGQFCECGQEAKAVCVSCKKAACVVHVRAPVYALDSIEFLSDGAKADVLKDDRVRAASHMCGDCLETIAREVFEARPKREIQVSFHGDWVDEFSAAEAAFEDVPASEFARLHSELTEIARGIGKDAVIERWLSEASGSVAHDESRSFVLKGSFGGRKTVEVGVWRFARCGPPGTGYGGSDLTDVVVKDATDELLHKLSTKGIVQGNGVPGSTLSAGEVARRRLSMGSAATSVSDPVELMLRMAARLHDREPRRYKGYFSEHPRYLPGSPTEPEMWAFDARIR